MIFASVRISGSNKGTEEKRREKKRTQDKPRQDKKNKTRQDETRWDEERRGTTTQDEKRRDETRRDETRRDETRRDETRQDKTTQDKGLKCPKGRQNVIPKCGYKFVTLWRHIPETKSLSSHSCGKLRRHCGSGWMLFCSTVLGWWRSRTSELNKCNCQ